MKRKLGSLNGWQRLWIVCGVLYLLIGGAFVVQSMPHDLTIDEYLGEAVDHGDQVPSETLRYVRIDNKWVMVEEIQQNNETNEYLYLLKEVWSQPASSLQYTKIPRTLTDKEMRLLKTKQFQFVGIGFAYLLASWLMVYVFGVAVAWTVAGFRNKGVRPRRIE
jgi:hypothetical protein